MCSGMGYWNKGTLGGCGIGGAIAAAVRIGIDILPMTPLWSKNAEWMGCVTPICWVMWSGSHIVRWSIQLSGLAVDGVEKWGLLALSISQRGGM